MSLTAIKMFSIFGSIWKGRSNIAQFLFYKTLLYVKNQPNLHDFFPLESIKVGEQILLMAYFDNCSFLCTLLLKMGSNFDLRVSTHPNPGTFLWPFS